jgi:hypothetical protein
VESLSVGLLSQVGTVRTAREIVQLLANLPAPLVVVYPRSPWWLSTHAE